MRAESLLLIGPEKLVWSSANFDAPGSSEVLVETLAGAISIGTELPRYLGNPRRNVRHYLAITHDCGRATGSSRSTVIARMRPFPAVRRS